MSKALLKLQIGPVQDFIAQARSTRDLWSGSYLLSWLMAAGLHKLQSSGSEIKIIYPVGDEQPILRLFAGEEPNPERARVPNLPNVLLAIVPTSEAKDLATDTAEVIREVWRQIGGKVWDFCDQRKMRFISSKDRSPKDRFDAQIRHFPSIAWQVTPGVEPLTCDWGKWTDANGRQLDAIRRTHAFDAWASGGWSANRTNNKDSLTGQNEAVAGGPEWRDGLSAELKRFFKHDDWVGAVTLVKRVWHRAYLPQSCFQGFNMPNTRGIAAHDPFAKQSPEYDDEASDEAVEQLPDSENYFTVLALDGDKIGKHIRSLGSDQEHTAFSGRLGKFALEQVCPMVADPNYDGRVIYAGGDDVLALLPADTALACAHALRELFCRAMPGLDVSAGIAIAHFKSPLQDVVRAARLAEKRAKRKPEQGGLDRSAVAVTLFKRSGETVKWGCKWEGGGLALYRAIAEALAQEKLSAKFPYRVVELLHPYLAEQTGLAKTAPSPGFETKVDEIIEREFASVCDRQRGPGWTHEVPEQLLPLLKKYASGLSGAEKKLRAVIGLCQTVAFARIRNPKDKVEPKGTP